MAATIFYLNPLPTGRVALLDGPEGRHAATVRRIGVGERLILSDGRGAYVRAAVTAVFKDSLELALSERQFFAPPMLKVTVVQALPKSDRSELAVELAVEAGADAIIPWQASRCVARWLDVKATKGVLRWQAVAAAAAKQSRRPYIPDIFSLVSTSELTNYVQKQCESGALVAVLHEDATEPLASLPYDSASELTLIVGPEGGVSVEEVQQLTTVGARLVRLGPTVLRTSTAAAVALGALGATTDRWDRAPLQ
ncbi:MAG: 16S rRNA (uracil(1498)-N(3))-methyltransferase [Mycobacteriaceae bacterium]